MVNAQFIFFANPDRANQKEQSKCHNVFDMHTKIRLCEFLFYSA